ncbi:geranylgeranyl pyrophosphate synthetase [Aspergillus niger]|nr:geranylgeranyl pyrophosphate synthetase [Aspergillus niger]
MLLALNEWLEVPEKKLQVIVRAVNLLLTASLLIGDIEDGSLLRRRQPVTHKVFGVAQTINSANHTYFLVQQCVQQLGNPQVVEIFTEELLNLHRGQGMDLFWRETLICPTEEEYLDMISNRTGRLFRLAIRPLQAESLRTSIRSNAGNRQPQHILWQRNTDKELKECARGLIESTERDQYCRQKIILYMQAARAPVKDVERELGENSQTGAVLDFLKRCVGELVEMLADKSFLGRAFIVTGGASGIGLEIVNELLRQSATVHVLDIASKFPETSQALQHRLHFYPATDVSSRESVSRTIKIIIQKCPDIHGLVNCAGVYRQSASVIDSDENFHKVMSVNLDGVWNTGTEYLRYVLDKGANDPTRSQPEQGPGSVEKCAGSGTSSCSMVNIGSTIVLQGLPGMAAYAASKHAIVGLTKSWAKDFASRGVRINCVAPGVTDTPLLRQHYTEASIAENWLSTIPMGRVGSCKEVANAVVFLLGDASSYITGQVLAVSGGFP